MNSSHQVDPFQWPSELCGDTFATHEAYRNLIRAAWDKNTWDLGALGSTAGCVLEDELPILAVGALHYWGTLQP